MAGISATTALERRTFSYQCNFRACQIFFVKDFKILSAFVQPIFPAGTIEGTPVQGFIKQLRRAITAILSLLNQIVYFRLPVHTAARSSSKLRLIFHAKLGSIWYWFIMKLWSSEDIVALPD